MVEVPSDIRLQLQGLAEQLSSMDGGDLPGLVAVGDSFSQLSLALEVLPLQAALTASNACGFSGQVAHRIVLDEFENREDAFNLLRQAAAEVLAALADGASAPISADLLNQLAAASGEVLLVDESGNSGQPGDSGDASGAGGAAAAGAASETGETGETGEAGNFGEAGQARSCVDSCASIESLDDAAMILVGVSPDDTGALKQVADGLRCLLGASDGWPELSRASVGMAADIAESLAGGTSGNGHAQLTEIGRLIEAAQEAADGFGGVESASAPIMESSAREAGQAGGATSSAATGTAGQGAAGGRKKPAAAAVIDKAALAAEVAEALANSDAELMGEFLAENLDHLEQAEASLLTLEKNSRDGESLNAIFRAFHTIKGTSGFLGLGIVQRVAHLSETLLDRCRTGKIMLTGGYADLTLESCDSLKLLMSLIKGHMNGTPFEVPDRIVTLMQVLVDPEAAGYDSESAPCEEDNVRVGDILVAQGKLTREQVEEAAQHQGKRPLGETLVREKAVSARDVASALRVQTRMSGGDSESLSVKVRLERLDSLINMVGELVIAHSLVAQDDVVMQTGGGRLSRNVSHMGKITRELQDLSMSLRMVPLKSTFQKMVRLVRDLSQKSQKQVQFETEGEETEIDRNMVEVINDPLVHMIRNSVDHGVEPPDARQACGKSKTGVVSLRAYHSAGSVVLELKDDGRGLDRDRIVRKAIERGLIESDVGMSDAEVYELIFRPGFSTAEKVTDVSGRGVGMDVVKRGVDALRGRIEVSSTLGKGTTFSMRLPLTLAIIDGMVVLVGGQRYIIPTSTIRTTFRPQAEQLSVVTERGEMVNFHQRMLPVFRMHKVFGIDGAKTDPTDALLLVVDDDGRQAAVLVDDLVGQQQVVVKSLGGALGQVAALSGGAIMGDGKVGLIVDVQGFVNLARGQQPAEQALEQEQQERELACAAAGS